MSRPAVVVRTSIIFIHRWLGVGLSLLFLIWFASGIVMMYRSFPSVSPADRLERSPVLDAAKIKLSAEEAYATLRQNQPPDRVLLNSFDGRPVYRFQMGRLTRIVYADDGAEQLAVPQNMMRRIASAWTQQPLSTAKEEAIEEPDQWTVQGPLRNLRPLWKHSFADGQQVYVSGATGEVVQYTTAASRFWAYLGAIPHWMYFTPLRRHQQQWSRFVIWSSGIGTVSAMLGIAIGLWMYSPRRRYRYAGGTSSVPYRGQKRWHMILGLIFGVFASTWAFSGMLSMDPFPSGDRTGAGTLGKGLRGRLQLEAFAGKHPREALGQIRDFQARELELASIMGEPMYVASSSAARSWFIPMRGEPFAEFGQKRVMEWLAAAAWPRELEVQLLTRYDAYYLDRNGRKPLPVLLAQEKDERCYIDPKTARVVGSYRSSQWAARWLYHGLHSLDFPVLYDHRPLWDIVVIALMLGGTALCVTSVILAWRVLGRKLAAVRTGRALEPTSSTEDMIVERES